MTPIQVLFPESKEQSKIKLEDDASSEGEDSSDSSDFDGFEAGTFEENIPSIPLTNPLAIIPYSGYFFQE